MENTLTGKNLIARGKAEGEALGLRRAILDLLEVRGVAITPEARERLEQEADTARLVTIHRAALQVGPDLAGLFPD